jgi:hypothetical protein
LVKTGQTRRVSIHCSWRVDQHGATAVGATKASTTRRATRTPLEEIGSGDGDPKEGVPTPFHAQCELLSVYFAPVLQKTSTYPSSAVGRVASSTDGHYMAARVPRWSRTTPSSYSKPWPSCRKRSLTDEVVLACDGVDACDYLFDPECDATSLLTPHGFPAKSDYQTNFSAGAPPQARGAANACRLW